MAAFDVRVAATTDDLAGSVSTDCPASILRTYDHVTLHLDVDSASARTNRP